MGNAADVVAETLIKSGAKFGARFVIAGRDDSRLHQAAADIGHGAEARAFDGDSAFDHVVVTASSTKTGSVRSTSLEDADASMDSKFFGAYRIARAAYDAMEKDARTAMLAAKAAALPVRRVGSPKDVADPMLFLASNGFVTGSTLPIDGGGSIA